MMMGFGDGSGIVWTIGKQSAPCQPRRTDGHLLRKSSKLSMVLTPQSLYGEHKRSHGKLTTSPVTMVSQHKLVSVSMLQKQR